MLPGIALVVALGPKRTSIAISLWYTLGIGRHRLLGL